MKSSTMIILPGLDGTNLLLNSFVALAPFKSVRVVALPNDGPNDYESLCERISEHIRDLDSCHLVAESFSGPLGILLARRYPKIIKRLTLVATFAISPVPDFARLIPWSILFRLPIPVWVARRYFVGSNRELVEKLKHAVGQTAPRILTQRMRCLQNVDVTEPLSQLECDIKYLRPRQDRLIPESSIESITKANSTVTVTEVDGPHLVLQAKPREAWKCIL